MCSTSPPTLREHIYLIGDVNTQICGNKLPSKLQVLQVLFHNIRHLKLSLNDSAALVIDEVLVFWGKARLPTQKKSRCENKLKSLYETWKNLQKSAGKPYNLQKEEDFCSTHDDLFDIAHGNIDTMFDGDDDPRRDFLMNQRCSGRVGYISDMEKIYNAIEEAQALKDAEAKARLEKSEREKEVLGKFFPFSMFIIC